MKVYVVAFFYGTIGVFASIEAAEKYLDENLPTWRVARERWGNPIKEHEVVS